MPNIYMVESDYEPVFVFADNFEHAVTAWRECYNKRWSEEPDVTPLDETDQPDQVVRVAEEDQVYIPAPSGGSIPLVRVVPLRRWAERRLCGEDDERVRSTLESLINILDIVAVS